MRLYCLRILIALFTFAAGVAAASLWGLLRAPLACPAYGVAADAPPPVTAAEPQVGLTPEPAPTKDDPFERCKAGQLPTDASAKAQVAFFSLAQNKSRSMPAPKYPDGAKAAGVEGDVMVQVLVGEDGGIMIAKALSGHELLRDAALDAACRSRFSPVLLSGRAVRFWGVMTYKFVSNR